MRCASFSRVADFPTLSRPLKSGSASSEPERSDSPERGDLMTRHRGLGRRTLLVSALTLVSRIVGFVREMLAAALFGDQSPIFDAFVTAWRAPNLFRRFLGEGALSTSLQTSITRADGEGGDAAGRALFLGTVRVTSWLLLFVCAAVMLVVYHLPDVMPFTGWPWLGADPAPVRELTVRVMPYVVLICLSALCMGGLQVRGHFAAPAFAPVLMNVVWVGALLVIGSRFGWPGDQEQSYEVQLEMARWLGWGVLLAGVAQLASQVPALVRNGLLGGAVDEPSVRDSRREAWAVLRRSAPLAIGAAVYQINVMVDGLMAEEFLRNGGPTAHYYANRIQQFPMALIAVAATSAVFPALQALGYQRELGKVRGLHDRTQLAVVFLALPASAGLFVLAEPLASVLFERGAYGADGVARIAAALRMLSLAVLPAGAVGLAGRTYYALGDFRTPVKISIAMLATNVVLNVAFVSQRGLGMDADGLALATSITTWGNLFLLLPGLSSKLQLPSASERVFPRIGAMASAAVACGLAAHFAHGAALAIGPVTALFTAIAAGAGAFFGAASLLGVEELALMRKRFSRK